MRDLAERAKGAAAVLLTGPTASGKSALAIELAGDIDGVIVNADSMQVYAELRVLTARPDAADEAAVPHRLYGHFPARERYSVGRWLDDLAPVLAEIRRAGKVPIVVGGTGLYFKALTEGLAAVPKIPAEVRERVLAEAEGTSSETLHARLAERNPEDASAIRPSDRARIVRALEVFEATGRSLVAWRSRPASPLIDPSKAARFVLERERAVLHERIARRAERMVKEGAIEEVRALGKLGLSPDLPAMKATGVRELLDHLAGKTSLDEALSAMKAETRRYAKRQLTWFRHQMRGWEPLPAAAAAQDSD